MCFLTANVKALEFEHVFLLVHVHYFILVAVEAYKWLVCYLLKESHRRLSEQSAGGKDPFTARSDSQAYYCRSLALTYIEVLVSLSDK